jgi:plasmid maintenance system killer protein
MYIEFKSKKLKKEMETFKECVRKYGSDNARKINQRISEMVASLNLEEFCKLFRSARCHPLKGNRKGQYAIDIKHPYRIIFEPIISNEAYKDDGSLDLSKVIKIEIIEVIDYHD